MRLAPNRPREMALGLMASTSFIGLPEVEK